MFAQRGVAAKASAADISHPGYWWGMRTTAARQQRISGCSEQHESGGSFRCNGFDNDTAGVVSQHDECSCHGRLRGTG
jgi:hypothetical protein